MRVSTKIISGAVMMMLLAMLAFVHLSLIHRMRSVNSELYATFNLAKATEPVLEDFLLVREYSLKYLASTASYSLNVQSAIERFQRDVTVLKREHGQHRSASAIEKLDAAWKAYLAGWGDIRTEADAIYRNLSALSQADVDRFRQHLDELVEPVMSSAEDLRSTIQQSVREDLQKAAAAGVWAENISWVAAVMVLVTGIVSIFLLRTINESLRRLTKGTRMIADGQFWHRLPADGGDEFAQLAEDFNSMSRRLGHLDNMKKDFVSHVSHELKAPLASIRQTFHLLLEEIPGPLNSQQRRLLHLSQNSAERLSSMVGNLLDVSRMEAGTMEYSIAPVDLLALAKRVAEEFEVQAREKEISIRVEAPHNGAFTLDCDRDRMIQVIGNLFDNALKFSPRRGEIVVTVGERLNESARYCMLAVRDSGIGVPDDHKKRIFWKFHQVKQGRKMAGQGVGLGLAICSSIIEAHRGKIWVEDNPAGGSIFCFELPAMARAEATTA